MIFQKFAQQVEKTPDKIAVKTWEHSITYKELAHRADRIAGLIQHHWKRQSEDPRFPGNVALLIEHGPHMIAAILGTLKAGKAYVPIAADYPDTRIAYILEHSRSAILLTTTGCASKALSAAASTDIPIIDIHGQVNENIFSHTVKNPATANNQLAYILYTSGSTGVPKGVMQIRENVMYYIDNWIQRFDITSQDHMTLFSSFSHDGSGQDMFSALLSGATLYPYDIRNSESEKDLRRFLYEDLITVWHSVPSLYNFFVNTLEEGDTFPHLRCILLGGEAFRGYEIEMFKRHFSHCLLANVYGQTESSVASIWSIRNDSDVQRLLIGDPLSRTEIYIIDEEGDEVEPYDTGEILVACRHISPGYWQDETTTSKSFFNSDAIGPYYRTGDLGRLLPDGNIEFMGRRDFQVKIRGYRVEISEIETALLRCEDICEAVVVPKQNTNADTQLYAFIVADNKYDRTQLREYLAGQVPEYMIPISFFQLDSLPRTQSNKTDRRALSLMIDQQETLRSNVDYIPPSTEMEKIVYDIWKEVLDAKEIGIHENLFDIGSNSFDVIKINSKLGKRLNRNIPTVKFFEHPTIASLAAYLAPERNKIPSSNTTNRSPVSTTKGVIDLTTIDTDIAVIGMAGRFPEAQNLNEFWNNIKSGKESITFFTDDQLEAEGVDKNTLTNPNYVKAGSLIDNIEYFDASFFGYTPIEAEILNPQTRVFYEVVNDALEDAGYCPDSYNGLIGLYAGSSINYTWEALTILSGKMNRLGHFVAGTLANKDSMSTRISYKLNLKGPSLAVRTACSTSLVAVHTACRALLTGECHMALAGGVTVHNIQKSGYLYEKGMVVSPDGHCRPFDAQAMGTIFGDGAGVVILKPLTAAIADRDNIYAVIKGTAVNNDGFRKVGFTAPSVEGQAEVIKAALGIAGIPAESVGYIETHGTGTRIGDVIEIEALKSVFNSSRRQFCALGSVKSNIGHLDSSAGIAGFIKTVLALKHRLIPPTLHFQNPNPEIDFENSPFYINTEPIQWQQADGPLRAGISSFGFGGTNAHALLEEAPSPVDSTKDRNSHHHLLLLSAHGNAALETLTANLEVHLKENPHLNIADVAYTLQVGRKHFSSQRAVVCKDLADAIEKLSTPDSKEVLTVEARSKVENPPVVFMFPGQGAQYVNMALDLYNAQPVFRQELDRCFDILTPLMGSNIKDNIKSTIKNIIFPDDSSIEDKENNTTSEVDLKQTHIAQPIIFIIEYALAKLLLSLGITPNAMVGHSIGEYTAACVSGVLSLEDSIRLVVLRGKLMQQLPSGSMLSVPLPAEQVLALIPPDLSLAAANSTSHSVVSGPHDSIDNLARKLTNDGINVRRLVTSHAFHSSMMDPILDQFAAEVAKITRNSPQIPYLSNVTGVEVSDTDVQDPQYWARHIRSSVRFSDNLSRLLTKSHAIFLEVGPGRGLSTFVRQHKAATPSHQSITLIRHPNDDESDNSFFLKGIARLWFSRVNIDWERFYSVSHPNRISLPTYPYQRQRYWFDDSLFKLVGNLVDGRPQENISTPSATNAQSLTHQDVAESLNNTQTVLDRPLLSSTYVAPVTTHQKQVATAWREILGIKELGIHDDFFELGGDSLKAMSIISLVHKHTGVEISIADLFAGPTIGELADRIGNEQGDSTWTAIPKADPKDYYPLSSAQNRLFLLHQLDPAGTGYNLPFTFTVTGNLDIQKVETSMQQLVARHESLRTAFQLIDHIPMQKILLSAPFELELIQLQKTSLATAGEFTVIKDEFDKTDKEEIDGIIQNFVRPFDLNQPPLMRAAVIQATARQYIFLLDMHHIITDGTSQEILAGEFSALYSCGELPDLPLQYKDYAHWQQGEEAKAILVQQEAYWLHRLAGEIPQLSIPTDFPRPVVQSFEGAMLRFRLDEEETALLKRTAHDHGVTMFTLLMTVYNIFLARMSNQEDILVGTPITGRRHADLKSIVGMFVNTLVLRSFPNGEQTFAQFLAEVGQSTLEAFENQDYLFEDLVEKVDVVRDTGRNPLFDVMLVLQNLPASTDAQDSDSPFRDGGLEIAPYEHGHRIAKFDFTLHAAEFDGAIDFKFEYCTKLFKEETATRFINYLKTLMSHALRSPRSKLKQLECLSLQEKQQHMDYFNGAQVEYPAHQTILHLFAQQVEKAPDNPAVTAAIETGNQLQWQSLSYRDLDTKSDALARHLYTMGVGMEHIVALMTDRSPDIAVAILGIMKTGAAYLPLDAEYPTQRNTYMLADSQTDIIVASSAYAQTVEQIAHGDKKIILIGDFEALTPEAKQEALVLPQKSERPAYIIYTSGTTGRPKGVVVEHRNLENLIHNLSENIYNYPQPVAVSMVSPIVFDASVKQIFPTLALGHQLVIIPNESRFDARQMVDILVSNRVVVSDGTPTHLSLILDCLLQTPLTESFPVRCFVIGGEVLSPFIVEKARQLVRSLLPNGGFEIINVYGPTECCDITTTYTISTTDEEKHDIIPIGTPLKNTAAYVIGQWGTMQPIGAAGELYICGAGTARGYLNGNAVTNEKFVPAPHGIASDARFYRTGDRVRLLADGNLQFMGRIDQQVKIRGFRIELEEIENRLIANSAIKEAVVVLKRNDDDRDHLCAYLTAAVTGTQPESIDTIQLREYLSDTLPHYMIPHSFTQLDTLPLTINGKVDRRALPSPVPTKTSQSGQTTPPRNKMETQTAEIWAQVLGRDTIYINDNFFMMGGDSIKAIQIISRMKRSGYNLKMRDVFQYPTISQLSDKGKIEILHHTAQQGPVTGDVPFTPIQHRFFQTQKVNPHHFNQAVMLATREPLQKEMVTTVFSKLQEHHDALRMVYPLLKDHNDSQPHYQHNRALEHPLSLQIFDFTNQTGPHLSMKLEETVNRIQGGINLEKGPLMKLALFRLKNGDRLLIVIHHLIIDGVSWRILLEDIDTLMAQYKDGHPLSLPSKSDSFRSWAQQLKQYADSPDFLVETDYWQQLEATIPPVLPIDFTNSDNCIKDTQRLAFQLSQEDTRRLQEEANRAFNTEINDLLLTALGLAINHTFAMDRLLLSLEGHGREEIIDRIDISRTVGWFTCIYPLLLDFSHIKNTSRQIKEIKETLRKVPNKGIGYGVYKYITAEEHKQDIEFTLTPEISFNYLGQFDTASSAGAFTLAAESAGNVRDVNQQRDNLLEFNGILADGRLEISCVYSEHQFKAETMNQLIKTFEAGLVRIIDFCCSREEIESTPSDFTYPHLQIDRFDRLIHHFDNNVEDIYRLSPMQEGMLFHSLMDQSSPAYFEQISYCLQGELDVSLVEKSLSRLVARHHMLRTAFIHEDLDHPLQVVLKNRNIDFHFEDISTADSSDAMDQYIAEFKEKDRSRPFDLQDHVLMRVAMFKTGASQYQLIWSFHHILMDGWCLGIIHNEFFEYYNSFLLNRPELLPEVKPYRNYIQWLEAQNHTQSTAYWHQYLAGYRAAVELPKTVKLKPETKPPKASSQHRRDVILRLSESQTTQLNDIAASSNVTLNTIMQSLWGILLGKYNHTGDVVFGTVVSGRPPQVAGIESMVGLFINTIPVRIRFNDAHTLLQLLLHVQANAVETTPYEYSPLADIQAESELKRNLLDQIFIFENYPIGRQLSGYEGNDNTRESGVSVQLSNFEIVEQTNYDFNIVISPGADSDLTLRLSYNGNVYSDDTVNRIARQVEFLVEQVCHRQNISIGELSLLRAEEKKRLLMDFNAPAIDFGGSSIIHYQFSQQALKTPGNIAVVAKNPQNPKDDQWGTINYCDLDKKSDQLARLLIENGIGRENIVGIMIKPSIWMVVGILGILKAGAAYLPIDAEYPTQRIKYMLTDSCSPLLLTTSDLNTPGLCPDTCNSVVIDDVMNTVPQNIQVPEVPVDSNNLAYVIYTSGTTGKPKGVMVEHSNLINLVHNIREIVFNYTHPIAAALISPIVFDASVKQLFPVLLNGHRLVIIPEKARLDSEHLVQIFMQHDITVSDGTPGHLALLLYGLSAFPVTGPFPVRRFVIGGDILKPAIVEQLFIQLDATVGDKPPLEIINVYGPTECCDVTTYFTLNRDNFQNYSAIPIGQPLPNTCVYITGTSGQLCPIGATGKLHISGAGMGRGYLNHSKLTQQTFAPNPYIETARQDTHTHWYDTGDLARWTTDGNIMFIGRADQQVKIRGFRIELGEIENRLLECSNVKDAAVITMEDATGAKSLCAYVVPLDARQTHIENDLATIDTQAIKESLAHHLPHYMIPTTIIPIPEIPLTINGKVDKNALPRPTSLAFNDQSLPATEVETKMAAIWAEVLELDTSNISVDADFFQLGGHSLKAVTMMAKIHKEFSIKIKLEDIFQAPTIRQLAQRIAGAEMKTYIAVEPMEQKEYYPLSSAQKRMYVLQQMHRYATGYNMPVILNLEGPLDQERLTLAFQLLLERHECLRTAFRMVNDEPVQVIRPQDRLAFDIESWDLQTENAENNAERINSIIKKFIRPFELSRAPLIRVGLIKSTDHKHILIVDIHHIVTDGVSNWILGNDFITLYDGEALPELKLQYKDFSQWQQLQHQSGAIKKQEAFWLNEYAGVPPTLNLPADFSRPTVFNYEGNSVSFHVDGDLFQKVQIFSQQNRTTPTMFLSAIYYILLYKYSGQEDIIVGTSAAGRRHADLQVVIGMFVNMLPIRNCPTGDKTFMEFLTEVRNKTMNAVENQDYQFDQLVAALGLKRDAGRNPLFNVVLNMIERGHHKKKERELNISPYSFKHEATVFDLILSFSYDEETAYLALKYATQLFKKATIEKMAERYVDIIKQVLENNEIKLGEIILTHDLLVTDTSKQKYEDSDFGF